MLDLLHSFSFASQNVISLDSSDNWSWLGFPSYTLWIPNSFLCCGTLLPGSVRLHKALQPEQNSFISIHFLISCMLSSGMYIYPLDNTGINNDPCFTFQKVRSILQFPVHKTTAFNPNSQDSKMLSIFNNSFHAPISKRSDPIFNTPVYIKLRHSIQLSKITKCGRIHSINMPYNKTLRSMSLQNTTDIKLPV